MTDKQIIDKLKNDIACKENIINHLAEHNIKLQDQLKAKKQECKDLREDIKDIANLLDLDTGEEYDFGNIELEIKQLKAKEQECEELKHDNEYEVGALEKTIDNLKAESNLFRTCHDDEQAKRRKYEQTLIEIKEVLQFYNNTTIGTDKGNGIFEFEVSNDNILGGKFICCYDTNPAKKALQKISECEVKND